MRNIVSTRTNSPSLKNVACSNSNPIKASVSNSYKYLQTDMDELMAKFTRANEIIGLEGDTFIQRAEMFFSCRPELSEILNFMYSNHRSLADRYETLSNRIQKEIPVLLREKYGLVELSSAPPGKTISKPVKKFTKNLSVLFETEDSSNENNAQSGVKNLKAENQNSIAEEESNVEDENASDEQKGNDLEEDENKMNLEDLKSMVKNLRKQLSMEKVVQSELTEYNSSLISKLNDIKNSEDSQQDVECIDKKEMSSIEMKVSKDENKSDDGMDMIEQKEEEMDSSEAVKSLQEQEQSELSVFKLEKELKTVKFQLLECQTQNEELKKSMYGNTYLNAGTASFETDALDDNPSALKTQLVKLKVALNASYRDSKSLQNEFVQVQTDLETSQQETMSLSEELSNQKDVITHLQVELNGYKKKNSVLRAKVTSLESELKLHKKKEGRFEGEVERLLAAMDSLKLEMHATERDLLRINAQLDVLQSENSELRKTLAQFGHSNVQYEEMMEELNQLKSILILKDHDIKTLKEMKMQTVNVLSASIEELRQENRYLLRKIKS